MRDWLPGLLTLFGGLIAAGVGAFAAMWTNNRRMAADLRAQRDAVLLEQSAAFVAATRRLRHLAERFERVEDQDGQRKALDEAHQQIRAGCQQLRLLGSLRVQVAARTVLRHAYAVRVQGEEGRDPRASEYPARAPVGRLNDALQEFYRAVRSQLKADDAEDVLHDDDLDDMQPGLTPPAPSQQAQVA